MLTGHVSGHVMLTAGHVMLTGQHYEKNVKQCIFVADFWSERYIRQIKYIFCIAVISYDVIYCCFYVI